MSVDDRFPPAAAPYERRAGAERGALLLHGYTGSPADLRELADYLADRGVSVSVPLLPGHGTTPHDLAKTTDRDWLCAVRSASTALASTVDRLYYVGFSFGGNLALHLAAEEPGRVRGVAAVCLPLTVQASRLKRRFLPLLARWNRFHRKEWLTNDERAEFSKLGIYDTVPLRSTAHFFQIIERMSVNDIATLKVPILLVHAKHDPVARPVSATFAWEHLTVTDRMLVWLSQARHNPFRSPDRALALSLVHRFIVSH